MKNKAVRFLAVSAIALTAGFYGLSHASAASSQSNDMIVAQTSGSSPSDSGRTSDDHPKDSRMSPPAGADSPAGPTTTPGTAPTTPTASVPARCNAMADAAQRQACINSVEGK